MDALDADDAARIDDHLRSCSTCAAALEEINGTLSAMRLLPAQELLGDWTDRLPELKDAAVRAALSEAGPADHSPTARTEVPVGGGAESAVRSGAENAPTVLTRQIAAPGAARRRIRVSWALAAAAAGIALGFGSSLLMPSDDGAAGGTLARPAGDAVVRATATTGITAALQPKPTGWGTEVVMELSGVDGPQRCSLVAVAKDGTEETAFTWQIPEGGYGLPQSRKERLLAVGGVGMPAADIAGYVIRTTDGKKLLSVPASGGAA
ncbi:hypothetical protein ACIPPJ_33285 [Streptomyces sp. NPDC086091]|uniref:hypothetical protein n=1 Tax=Streptomyces sp. NPDC086091 TaxID=3365751 RepID=UPI0038294EEC